MDEISEDLNDVRLLFSIEEVREIMDQLLSLSIIPYRILSQGRRRAPRFQLPDPLDLDRRIFPRGRLWIFFECGTDGELFASIYVEMSSALPRVPFNAARMVASVIVS